MATVTKSAAPIINLQGGVQLGKLAIITTGVVDVVTPGIAAIVTSKAILVNRGQGPRVVTASTVNPLEPHHVAPNGQTWGPVTLAPGAMALLPAPASGLSWFVVDISRRTLQELDVLGWVVGGFAVLGAVGGAWWAVDHIRAAVRRRRTR